jgi:hypothetical protein
MTDYILRTENRDERIEEIIYTIKSSLRLTRNIERDGTRIVSVGDDEITGCDISFLELMKNVLELAEIARK